MLSKFSVKKPYTVLVAVIMVLVLGGVSLYKMTADLIPSISFPYVLIITTDIGASPEEIESGVTAPMEASMATTSNIKTVSSMSYNSYSMVILEYEQSANMDSILIEIQQKLDQLESTLPDSVGTPMVMQIDPDMMPIMIAAVDVDNMEPVAVTNYVNNDIKPLLESVEGVASANMTGGIEEKINITVNSEKVDALNERIKKVIDDKFVDAEKEITSAKNEINSGKNQLETGANQLANTVTETETELNSKKIELYQAEQKLTEQQAQLENQAVELQNSIDGLKKAYDGAVELKKGIDGINQILGLYEQGFITEEQFAEQLGMDVETARATAAGLEAQLDQINTQLAEQGKSMESLGVTINSYEDLPNAIAALESALTQVKTGIQTVKSGLEQIKTGKASIDSALNTLGKTSILSSIEMGSANAQLASGESQLESAKTQISDSKEQAYQAADLETILSTDTVKGLLTAQNFSMPAGYIAEDGDQYLVKVGDKITDIDTIKDTVLIDMGMEGIEPIKIGDIADVELVNNQDEVYAKVNGNPAVLFTFEKQTGYSTGDVTDSLLAKFKSVEKEFTDVHFTALMDQGVYIDLIVSSVLKNIIEGAILAIVVLIIFLRDLRPTFIIAAAIPLSVIFAIVLMYFTGITLNVISMSGLALGIGMLVDNSIVVIENIYRMRSEGCSIKKASVYGASQVAGAIAASTITTVCVFLPIVFTEGITRQLFTDMALTIGYTLGASLIVALTLVPAMASGMLRKEKVHKKTLFDRFQEAYGRFVGKALKYKIIVFLLSLVFLGASVYAAFSRGTSFMPSMSGNQLTLTVSPKEDEEKTLEEMAAMSDEIVDRVLKIKYITTVGAMSGSGSTMSLMSSTGAANTITMYVLLEENGKYDIKDIQNQIIEATKDLDCDIKASSEMLDMSALTGSGISINIKGRNIEKMQEIAGELGAKLEKVEGLVDVDNGLGEMTKELVISVDKEKAANYGYTVAQVFQLVYGKMASTTEAAVISTDIKDYSVYIQTDDQSEATLDDIRNLTFTYTDKNDKDAKEEEIKLSDIAEIKNTETLSTIRRSAQSRYITVSASVDEDHNVGLLGDEVQKIIDKMEIPEGYTVTLAGENETINDAMRQVVLMLALAIVFIYLVMVAQFQSLLSPFIIMFTIPLAFTGGFLALYLTGNEVSIIAMIGFVLLSGIIVNNGIVMVDYINQRRREGLSKKEAIVDAAVTRLRPVLMTALTTIISMSALALSNDQGASMMRPMAIVSVGGLVYGTLLTLIVVPCIYDAFNRDKSMVEEDLEEAPIVEAEFEMN